MDVKCTVQETGTCATGAILAHSLDTGLDYTLITCKTSVSVGSKHENFVAFHFYFCALLALYFPEIRIYTPLNHLLGKSIFR